MTRPPESPTPRAVFGGDRPARRGTAGRAAAVSHPRRAGRDPVRRPSRASAHSAGTPVGCRCGARVAPVRDRSLDQGSRCSSASIGSNRSPADAIRSGMSAAVNVIGSVRPARSASCPRPSRRPRARAGRAARVPASPRRAALRPDAGRGRTRRHPRPRRRDRRRRTCAARACRGWPPRRATPRRRSRSRCAPRRCAAGAVAS